MFHRKKKILCSFSTWITFQILKKKIYTLIFEQDVVGTLKNKRTSTIILECVSNSFYFLAHVILANIFL